MNTTTGSWLVVWWIKKEKIIRLVIKNNWESTPIWLVKNFYQ